MAQMAEDGSLRQRHVLDVLNSPPHINRYLSTARSASPSPAWVWACTASTAVADWLLGPLEHLGWVGDALAHTVATVAAVGMLTYLHVVVGEMVPKSLALQNAAHAVIWLSNSMRLAEILFRPLTAVLNGLGNLILRLSGLPPADVESKLISSDELSYILEESGRRAAGAGRAGLSGKRARFP
ncbi:MAG: CNNM domain-containing protein [Caldilineaceae bacterium]